MKRSLIMNRVTYEKIYEKFVNKECVLVEISFTSNYIVIYEPENLKVACGVGISPSMAQRLLDRIMTTLRAMKHDENVRFIDYPINLRRGIDYSTESIMNGIKRASSMSGRAGSLYVYNLDSMKNGADYEIK